MKKWIVILGCLLLFFPSTQLFATDLSIISISNYSNQILYAYLYGEKTSISIAFVILEEEPITATIQMTNDSFPAVFFNKNVKILTRDAAVLGYTDGWPNIIRIESIEMISSILNRLYNSIASIYGGDFFLTLRGTEDESTYEYKFLVESLSFNKYYSKISSDAKEKDLSAIEGFMNACGIELKKE